MIYRPRDERGLSESVRTAAGSLFIGVLAALIAAVAVEIESKKRLPIGTALLFVFAVWALYAVARTASPRLRAAFGSPVVGYYPRGQSMYTRRIVRDLKKSRTVTLIGARGRDLIGEGSPIGQELDDWHGTVQVFLLSSSSDHARLRTGHLEVERDKYTAEVLSVQAFLNVVSLHNHLSVELVTYDVEPLARAVIFDRVAYIAPYIPHVQGRALPTFRIARGSPPGRAGHRRPTQLRAHKRCRYAVGLFREYRCADLAGSTSATEQAWAVSRITQELWASKPTFCSSAIFEISSAIG